MRPETDPDGVTERDTDDEVHENTRRSTEGVETTPAGATGGSGGGAPAAGLIGGGASGLGEMDDPREGIVVP